MKLDGRSGLRWSAPLMLFLVVTVPAVLLVGCGAVGGGGASGSVVALWLMGLTLIGFLVGCGGGGTSTGDYEAGAAASTSATASSTPSTPVITPTTPVSTPTPTPAPPFGPPARLGFQVQPTKGAADKTNAFTLITPAVQVAVLDAQGRVVTNATNAVTISLGGAAQGRLIGTLTQNAVNGIATFADLQISLAGGGYTLVASASGLSSADTAQFVVNPLPPDYFDRRQFVPASFGFDIVQGDFNGDGKPDLAVASADYSGRQGAAILLGNGDGTFSGPTYFTSGGVPNAIATGDLNGDGKPDLVTANTGSSSVSVLLGVGDGTFGSAANLPTVPQTTTVSVAVGDVDNDGRLDIVSGNSGNDTASVFLGNGDGTFKAPRNIALPPLDVRSVLLADFNGDHRADLAVDGRTGAVTLLLSNGDGTFQAGVNFPVGGECRRMAAADLNGDGSLDLVVPNSDSRSGIDGVSVLLGNGDGTFRAAVNYATSGPAFAAVAADVDGDGRLDLVCATTYKPGFVDVLLGNGDGTFQAPRNFGASAPLGVAVGDFDGNGLLDVATSGRSSVSVLLARTAGDFVDAPTVADKNLFSDLVMADVNGDGKLDLVTTQYAQTGGVAVLIGNGDGTFKAPVNYAATSYDFVALGDLNGDGTPDILAAGGSYNQPVLSVLLGRGDGTFQSPLNTTLANRTVDLLTGDFDGDGKLDAAVALPKIDVVTVLPGNGDGTFRAAVNTDAPPATQAMASADLNGDGRPDLVLATYDNSFPLRVMLGNGDGTFQAPANYALDGTGAGEVTLADLNGDSKLDIIARAGYPNNDLAVLLGNGDGTFGAPRNVSSGDFPTRMVVADVNADGRADIVTANGFNSASILLGNGDATFQAPIVLGTTSVSRTPAVGDLNGDQKQDIVVQARPGITVIMHN